MALLNLDIKTIAFILGTFLFCSSHAKANEGARLSYEYKVMQDDWSFLPEPPESFESTKSSKLSIGYIGEKYGLIIGRSDLGLELLRSTEPKDVSLDVITDEIDFYYNLDQGSYFRFGYSNQMPDDQVFDCYGFGSLIIGSCDESDIQITSTNPIYEGMNGSLITLNAETKSYTASYIKELKANFFQEISIGITSTDHQYDWKTPIEAIASPFLLGLSFDGQTLGSLIDQTLSRLPQREPWKLHQLNLDLKGLIFSKESFDLFYQTQFRFFKFDDYKEINDVPSYNAKLRLGLRTNFNAISIEFYGDVYKNNLIGFQPITFNQRTEHQFDKKYGEIGISIHYNY